MSKSKGMTLMELMITTVIVGVMAGFAIANYNKALMKEHERNAVLNLKAIHSASIIYKAKTGKYMNTGGTWTYDLAMVNSTLGVNVIPDSMRYQYYSNPPQTQFLCYAAWGTTFRVGISQAPISSANPCCLSGTSCPSLAPCGF